MLVAGPEAALEIHNTFIFDDNDDKKLEVVIEKFQEKEMSRVKDTFSIHIFNTRCQHRGETVYQFVTDLKKKAKPCEFGELNDSLIKDRIVCGIVSDKTSARLLMQNDLTLPTAIEICRGTFTRQVNGRYKCSQARKSRGRY